MSNEGICVIFGFKITYLPLIVKVTFRFLYLISALFFVSVPACKYPVEKDTYTMRRKQVFVIRDTTGETRKPPPLPSDTSYLEYIFSTYNLTNIAELDSTIMVDLKYASADNVLESGFYDGLRKAYFTCPMALKVAGAQYHLRRADSTLSLMILDAARPHHIQRVMWDSINLRPEKKDSYLAHPESPSLHNYGCAVDATIIDLKSGKPLDMGSDFDYFSRVSRPDCEKEFLANGMLTTEAVRNRRKLRWAMKAAGLKGIASEWWHFSLCTREEAAERFPLIK
jgi:zinc D-Ala-D-Ala dipeptidase